MPANENNKDSSLLGRSLILAYGLAVYAIFQFTFLYLIGFVEGFGVPKNINDGQIGSFAMAVAVNGGFLALFAIQHTIMARPRFKAWWNNIIHPAAERSTFVLVTCIILLGMVMQWRPLPGVIWHVEADLARVVLLSLSLTGFGIVLFSSFLIDHFALFGLRQVWSNFRNRPMPEAPFVERSFYRHVRHPLMLGFLVAFWSTPDMTFGRLVFALLTTGYIVMGTRVEERDLVKNIGKAYDDYRRRTPMLIPRLRTHRSEVQLEPEPVYSTASASQS